MNARKIVGILILVILILSLVVVCANAILSNEDHNNKAQFSQVLKDNELQSLSEEDENYDYDSSEGITEVNLNIKQKTGGVRILFAKDTNNVYNITSTKKDSKMSVTKSVNGSTLNVNVNAKDSETTIVLSTKYRYNITGAMTAGGLQGDLDNSRIDTLNFNIVMGGINLNLTNTTHLDKFNSNITMGGINIIGNGQFGTNMNTNVDIGGINIESSNPIVLAKVNVNLGGAQGSNNYQTSTDGQHTEIKGNQYDSADNKLLINSNIEIGGLSVT